MIRNTNSLTNAIHALALAIYSGLVLKGFLAKQKYFSLPVFIVFFLVLLLKLIGIVVHLPSVENNRKRHNFYWIVISVLIIALNAGVYLALEA